MRPMGDRFQNPSARWPRAPGGGLAHGLWTITLGCVLVSCGRLHTSDPPRTATEQFLLSASVREAVEGITAQALHDRPVYVDASRLKSYVYKNRQLTEQEASPEQKFLAGELRAALLERGVRLVDAPEKAQIILELWSGGIGIDRYETIIGVPSAYFTGVEERIDAPLPKTPEVVIYKSRLGLGVGDVAFAAYWAATGELIALSHPPVGFGVRKDIRYLLVMEKKTGNVPTFQGPER